MLLLNLLLMLLEMEETFLIYAELAYVKLINL